MKPSLWFVCAASILFSGCASAPSGDLHWLKGQWPVGDFEGYDPYPAGAPGRIHAYVQFGNDGLLRASLGCAKMGAPFVFTENRSLKVTNENGLSATSYVNLECDEPLIAKEQELALFLESTPKIGRLGDDGLPLTKDDKRLLLQSVAHVLDEDTKLKVDL
ncbi:MAG: hypothetical protein AAF642_11080 [Pseudomonadota bacterium]